MTDLPIHLKYRPRTLSEMYGQAGPLKALDAILNSREAVPHSYLLIGPSGVGKTTLARIIARTLGIDSNAVTELDGATNRGIDAMREVAANMRYGMLAKNPERLVIIDECHALTKDAWQSLLKILEEPPSHLYWVLCTTDELKIPRTVFTRCATFVLGKVDEDDLIDLLFDVADLEKWQVPREVINFCAYTAVGSPRAALQNLSSARYCKTRDEAFEVVRAHVQQEEGELHELARIMCDERKCKWPAVIDIVKRIQEGDKKYSPESARLTILGYAARVLFGLPGQKPNSDMKQVAFLLFVIEQFSEPFYDPEKFTPLLRACGRVAFSDPF